jgi:signal transduction histidine kinase
MTYDPSDLLDLLCRSLSDVDTAATADEVLGAIEQANREVEAHASGDSAENARRALEKVRSIGVELTTTRAQLAATRRMRDALLAGISHDLRNPLNTFAMSAGLLRDDLERGDMDSARGLGLVGRMDRAVERMQRLIDDMLEASRIEAGQIALHPKPELVSALVRDAMSGIEAAVREKRANVVIDELADERVVVDRARGVQLLGKVLAYAVKTIGEGGTVRISAVRESAAVAFAIRALAVSQRTPRATMDDARGGLSLLIARALVESHGGSFNLGLEDGAAVLFTLPAEG